MPTLTLQQALAHALQQHRAGKLAQAESIYRQVLTYQPGNTDAMHLLAILLHQDRQHEAALEMMDQAIAIAPQQTAFHIARGQILTALQRMELATIAFMQALQLDPHSIRAMSDLATTLHLCGDQARAVKYLRQALVIAPDDSQLRTNLGCILKLQGIAATAEQKLDAALQYFEESVELNPADAETLNLLGALLHRMGQLDRSIELLRKAVALVPASEEAQMNLGSALLDKGLLEESLVCFRQAIAINPVNGMAYNNLGNALSRLDQWPEAIEAYQQAIAHRPQTVEASRQLGSQLDADGQRERERQAFAAPNALAPRQSVPLNNLGYAYAELLQLDLAMEQYRKALQLVPDFDGAHWNVALLQLLRGDFETGWIGYECRWRQERFKKGLRNFVQPMLPSQRSLSNSEQPGLAGKRVLLHAEQGFGDALQFCRYAPLIADLGATVILEAPAPLTRLLSTLHGISEIIPAGQALPPFDFHCPLMSLPMIFGTTLTTLPAVVPYLAANPADVEKWKERLAREPAGLRVGLAWAGGLKHERDRLRSLALANFAAIGRIPGITFISLQLGDPAAQAASPPDGMQLRDWTMDVHDFADTAALVSNLDLVITVDTSVAHLAGALGKPVWLLLPFNPDWRWLLDRDDSPWYPTARLFRQKSRTDWSVPLESIAEQLRPLAAGR